MIQLRTLLKILPFYNGKVIKPALNEMFHHVTAINPNLEVYPDPKRRDHIFKT
jgi:hypothetical protein